jgi:broad specificity phosphatase PhoE
LQNCFDLYKDFDLHNGTPPNDELKVWETAESMKKRMNKVLEKYIKYQKIIVVSHGILIRTIRYQEKIAHADVIEYCT